MSDAALAATAPAPLAGKLRRYWFDVSLWKRTVLALVAGVAVGSLLGEDAGQLKWLGDLFVRLIRMLVAPLVFVIIVSGIAALGDPRRLGSIGLKTLGLYVLMVTVAVAIGLGIGTWIQPGAGVALAGGTSATMMATPALGDIFLGIVPLNPIRALAEGEMLSIIFFGMLVGIGIISAGERATIVAQLFDGATAVMLRLVQIVMEVAPFGVFALIASVVGTNGLGAFTSIFWLGACVILGSAIQTLLVHGGLVRFGARLPIGRFFRGSSEAILVGFSTASSSAALPVAMSVAEKNLGIGTPVASTVLPLGATIGMDGSAMYIAFLSMFAVQAFGVPIGPADYLVLLVSIVAIAMGTAPIPSASLFLLAAVLTGVGISAEQTALLVGFILPFDRPLDMIRTIPNVTSDLAVAAMVARSEGEIDLAIMGGARSTAPE
ncbi:dicarboxylate/amino acid:cation symporter [Sphingomonas panaciterrae]|uniref:dicarboxylate/amino acid:cation symporter n=1 Tax=Sphingomonas panaciterrae TaxID=1462999 RepID=UPI002FF12CB4